MWKWPLMDILATHAVYKVSALNYFAFFNHIPWRFGMKNNMQKYQWVYPISTKLKNNMEV